MNKDTNNSNTIEAAFQEKVKAAYDQAEEKAADKVGGMIIPPFPFDGLPSEAQGIIREYSEVYGTHPDFWAYTFIQATAAAIGATHIIRTKYDNAAIFWAAIIADSGIGKTEPCATLFKPFHRRDAEAITAFRTQKAEFDRIKNMSSKDRKDEGIELPPPPVYKQHIIIDSTPEAKILVNIANPRGITEVRDELIGKIKDKDRYNTSGAEESELSGWSGQSMSVNRKGADPLMIENPHCSMYGGLQTGAVSQLAGENRSFNGYLPRLCIVFPDEAQRPKYSRAKPSQGVQQAYEKYITNLLALDSNEGKPNVVTLCYEADTLYELFVNMNTALINSTKTDYLKAAYAKLDIIVLRLALVIHLSKWACTGIDEPQVTVTTMQAAINMTEYFRKTQQKLCRYLSMGGKPEMTNKDVIKWLRSNNPDASQREIAAAIGCQVSYVNKILNPVQKMSY